MRFYDLSRWFVALAMSLYGFAKLFGAQFTVLDSELDKPMREVPGFWLTWYYYSYSAVYGNLLALTQIAGGLMLTFRRTTLAGAVLLFGILSNIVLVDIFYGVDAGGLIAAVVLWLLVLAILFHHRRELRELFWNSQPAEAVEGSFGRGRAIRWFARASLLLVPALFTFWIANYNNRLPTPIDGRWRVQAAAGLPLTETPLYIYFERNRAHLVVFRYENEWRTHHFDIESGGRISIAERWLVKGAPIFSGIWRLDGRELVLEGRHAATGADVRLDLERM
ncbi:MAG TPA: hypothetical protein VF701_14625 [Thermoanaerobaculia bacterium]